ncbi:MAG: glycoside hydrolase family 15 protein [Terriglobales bacterium]
MEETSKIGNYALIGDLHTAALITERGSLNWLCWPDFDSEACFARLLGASAHGFWSLSPSTFRKVERQYLPGTLILQTTYTGAAGAVAIVTDFMTIREKHSCLVRIVRGIKGRSHLTTVFSPRFDYGAVSPRIRDEGKGAWSVISGPHRLNLRTDVQLRCDKNTLFADWSLRAGNSSHFTLQYSNSFSEKLPKTVHANVALKKTAGFWKQWIGRNRYRGQYREQVQRSLITLKALTYAPSGGFVAAPTTSLPEKIGGVRNWDYRFCWLRDTTFSLQGLLECGFEEEARDWLSWLNRSIMGDPSQLKIMYGITGKREHTEWVADWLPGYAKSRPVHIGNKASSQLQLDTYGEMLDSIYRSRRHNLYPNEDESGEAIEVPLLSHLEKIWSAPDEGLWEFRSGPRQFTHSKVMAWVAFDRGIRMVEEFGIKGPVDRWRKLRSRIHSEVCEKGFHRKMNSFTQSYGTKHLDASLLLMPIVGFLPVEDERIAGTVRAIEKCLMRDGLLLRYDTEKVKDGQPAGEGAFLTCNFWLIDVYLLQGRHEEAKRFFERLLSICNGVGLLSEEYDGKHGLVGNFPQAFSHIGLINAAMSLHAGTSLRRRKLDRHQK